MPGGHTSGSNLVDPFARDFELLEVRVWHRRVVSVVLSLVSLQRDPALLLVVVSDLTLSLKLLLMLDPLYSLVGCKITHGSIVLCQTSLACLQNNRAATALVLPGLQKSLPRNIINFQSLEK